LAEHPEFEEVGEDRLRAIIDATLGRIALFEAAARRRLAISPEVAENIGTIWVLSGTGSYDERFKGEDPPCFRDKLWMGGFDRARLSRGALLARKIAEVRSGRSAVRGTMDNLPVRKAATKELIAQYGPAIVYNGYPCETEFVEKLLDRDGIVMPKEKVKIIHADLKVTTDQVRTFTYPDDPSARDKEVAILTHAPHLARVLHMANRYKPFAEGAVPYVAPVATPDAGRRDFALMETRGLLYYTYLRHDAAEKPHSYELLC
jgi:hypothetical protein